MGAVKAKLASSLAAALALGGCDDIPQARTEADIERIAVRTTGPELEQAKARIDRLELRLGEIEAKQAGQEAYAKAISADLDSTSKQVANNAKAANSNAIQAMTERGACGREWAVNESGVSYLRNKRCTKADLSSD